MQCKFCGKETHNPKFCSRSCSVSFNNSLSPRNPKQDTVCKACGKEFYGNYCKIYCSDECRENYQQSLITARVKQTGCYYSSDSNPGSKTIRKYLVKCHGNNCMVCGQSGHDWHGKPMTLIVDHINGHANDWSIDNIQLVCPNCDSQLSTYKGRNKGNSTRKYTITQK